MSLRSLTIECDQVYHRLLLSSKHTLQPTHAPLLSVQHFHTCTPSTEAHRQMHSQHTEISTHACTSSTDAHQQIHSHYTEANTQACTPSIETHQMHTEASTKIQMHSIHTDTTEVSHAHMANFTQQLSHLFIPHQLNKKPHTPIRLYTLQVEFTIHPDWTFVDQLIHDLQHGCDIGYIGPQFLHYSNNLPSSFQHPSTLDNNITTEYNTGRILGPFGTPPLHNF